MIDPLVITADDTQRANQKGFRLREFWRVVALTGPYRRSLIVGLLCSVLFAGLHTASIGAAFPVFQVLLEDEGLQAWGNRTIAGHRLGVEFGPLADADAVRILKIHQGSRLLKMGVGPLDTLWDARSTPIRGTLQEMAYAPTNTEFDVLVGSSSERRAIRLTIGEAELQYRALRWATGLLPPDAPGTRLRTLGYILMVLVFTAVASNSFRYIGEVLIANAVLRALMDLRDILYRRTLRLPMVYFADTATADIVTRFVQDVQEIQRGLVTLFGKFIREPLRALFILGLALKLDWKITLTVSVVVPIAVAFFWAVGRSVKRANRKLLQAYGHMIATLTASLQNLRVVKTCTAEAHEEARLDEVDRRMFRQQFRLARLDAFLSPMMEVLAVIAGSLLTVWLASRVLDQQLTISRFAAIGVTLSMLFDPLRKMSDVYVRIQRSTAGAERIFQVVDHPIETDSSLGHSEVGVLREAIEYANVTFTYPGASVPAVDGVGLRIERGETVAVVGPNGCGKTTLASMLPRLFDPQSGEVRYDGMDLRRASLSSLRKQINVVTQEAVVFGGTPLENIGYGDGRIDRARAEAAARQAYADEFIRNLPGGYDAQLGERGTTLSGGQRQRLAIARAIYRDAPILIFDEATSQIDTESELKIQTALRELAKDRTTIIIAHRLSTIQFAGRIIVMNAGRVIDSGTHRELFDRCMLYHTLCETQFVNETG